MNTEEQIKATCESIKKLLLDKNKKYGNSALEPIRIFSRANTVEQLLVRIDDKLSRISRGVGLYAKDEDVIDDTIGYLILLKIAINNEKWDGTDIEPTLKTKISWDTFINNRNPLNDSEWLDMHLSGDKFA
jgi:hypothetical protein